MVSKVLLKDLESDIYKRNPIEGTVKWGVLEHGIRQELNIPWQGQGNMGSSIGLK